jgi:hypothetical protein
MTEVHPEEADSRHGTAQGRSGRIRVILGAIGLVLWLTLLAAVLWPSPTIPSFVLLYSAVPFYTALGPLVSVALLKWAVHAGLVRQQELEGQLLPNLAAGVILVSVVISISLGGAWRWWRGWELWLAVFIPVVLGYLAGSLIRQGVRRPGRVAGVQCRLPSGTYLTAGNLLWVVLLPVLLTFIVIVIVAF